MVALGPAVREEPLCSDALAVVRETMRRARANIETLIPRLHESGYEFGYGWAIHRGALDAAGDSLGITFVAKMRSSAPVASSALMKASTTPKWAMSCAAPTGDKESCARR